MAKSAFDTLMAATNPVMIVVTTVAADERAGCLVGFHSQSGIDTGHYCVWLSKANHTYRTALRATHFGVHFLTADDLGLAKRFGTRSGEDTDKFAGLKVSTHDTGVPLLDDCPNRLIVQRLALLDDGADHVCITTRVLDAQAGDGFTPLRVADVSHLKPGHGSEERAIQP